MIALVPRLSDAGAYIRGRNEAVDHGVHVRT